MSIFKQSITGFILLNIRSAPQIRLYSRWTSRRPRRVLTREDLEQNESQEQGFPQKVSKDGQNIQWKHPEFEAINTMEKLDSITDSGVKYKVIPKKVKKSKPVPKEPDTSDMLQTVIDADGKFVYTKLKDHDPVFSNLLIDLKSKKMREGNKLILLEGKRLIKDALEAKCHMHSIFFSQKQLVEYVKPFLPKTGANIYKVPYREIQMWSDLTTSPGIMGIFKKPDTEKYTPQKSIPLSVICDNIRDPGNLGGVLRTLAGVGVQEVVLTKGCTDLWDFKVLRGASGAHFRMKIRENAEWSNIRKHLDKTDTNFFIADNNILSPTQYDEQDECDDEEKSERVPLETILSGIPLLPYYGVDFTSSNALVMVVGGETEGISEEAYRLTADFNGARLNVPLCNGVESLNVGAALGVLVFEIKRQLAVTSNSNVSSI